MTDPRSEAQQAFAAGREAGMREAAGPLHQWMCGCGWVNGSNLSVCAMCNRTPKEGNAVPYALAKPQGEAQRSEPVAWLCESTMAAVATISGAAAAEFENDGYKVTPLYTASAPNAEELAKVVLDNLSYLENLIDLRGHESGLLKNHPRPCVGHDFCLMRQAQKGADAIRAYAQSLRGKK